MNEIHELKDISEYNKKKGPSGIGGWLILPLIGLIISLIKTAFVLLNQTIPFINSGVIDKLSDPSHPKYSPLWNILSNYELIGNLIFVIFPVVLLIQMFAKSKLFPKLMIALYSTSLIYLLGGYFFYTQLPTAQDLHNKATVDIIKSLIAALIWIPYFRMSVRVKNTFVH